MWKSSSLPVILLCPECDAEPCAWEKWNLWLGMWKRIVKKDVCSFFSLVLWLMQLCGKVTASVEAWQELTGNNQCKFSVALVKFWASLVVVPGCNMLLGLQLEWNVSMLVGEVCPGKCVQSSTDSIQLSASYWDRFVLLWKLTHQCEYECELGQCGLLCLGFLWLSIIQIAYHEAITATIKELFEITSFLVPMIYLHIIPAL